MPSPQTDAPQESYCNSHGQMATRPGQIPAKGWRDIFIRVRDGLTENNVSIIAAGVAFYGLLGIFPALAALISIYGLMANPADVQQQISSLSSLLPNEAHSLLNRQLTDIASGSATALGAGALIGLLVTLWSASQGIKSLMTALNIVYHEQENRSFIKFTAVALLLTIGALMFAILALGLIVALPALLGNLGLQEETQIWVSWLRWPLLILCVMVSLAVIYRYGPSRRNPRWQWVSWGAAIATLLWIVGSGLFSLYVSHFGSYNETYGSVGAVVILLMWFYVSAFVVLLGAELNAEMEHQTSKDSTVGRSKPIGKRGAYMADTVGKMTEDRQ